MLGIEWMFLTEDKRRMSRTEVKRKIRSQSSMESVSSNDGGLFEVDATSGMVVVGGECRWRWLEAERQLPISNLRSSLQCHVVGENIV
jgi:hypothetical protein